MCAAMLPADSHMDNFLSPVIRDKNEGPMPSLILRELLGKNEDIRSGLLGVEKTDRVSSGYRMLLSTWKRLG
jgi:hypothetical protein